MDPKGLVSAISTKWQVSLELLHTSLKQAIESHEEIDTDALLGETLNRASDLTDEFEGLLDQLRKSLS